ncbi:MAG: class I SAM-dependent methyltransferase [Methanomicrobiales archaeon]|nr:class I SAM-dependent methyltransferase [Methanomicrobiales archaeon]
MIPSRRVFDELAGEYDRWFDEHPVTWESQIHMLRSAVPGAGRILEVGVGSGRFAGPLGIGWGIDPSREQIRLAQERGVVVVLGEGEHLPYRPGSFDCVLMMTVICFVEDPQSLFREAFRVLAPKGCLVVGFLEREGEIAVQYREEKTKGRFLRYAKFPSVVEVTDHFERSGFSANSVVQRTRGFSVMKATKEQRTGGH